MKRLCKPWRSNWDRRAGSSRDGFEPTRSAARYVGAPPTQPRSCRTSARGHPLAAKLDRSSSATGAPSMSFLAVIRADLLRKAALDLRLDKVSSVEPSGRRYTTMTISITVKRRGEKAYTAISVHTIMGLVS